MPQLLHGSVAEQPAHARRGRCALLVTRAAADESAADGEEEDGVEEDGVAGGPAVWKPKQKRPKKKRREEPIEDLAYELKARGEAEEEWGGLNGASRHAAAAALLRDLPGVEADKELQGWLEQVVKSEEGWLEEGQSTIDMSNALNTRFFEPEDELVVPSAPLHSGQVALDEWELRAIMEKRRAKEKAYEEWMEKRADVGRYPRIAADWRSDVRIRDTGDPSAPEYREWTHREIWDLITMGGKAADPRIVQVEVRDPKCMTDAVAEGAKYVPETEELMAQAGMLIDPEDEEFIVDKQTEEALLASEFTDFDEEYLTSGFSDGAASFDEMDTSDNF